MIMKVGGVIQYEPDVHHHDEHQRIFDECTGTRATSTSVGPFPGSWLAARMAALIPDLQVRVCLS